MTRLARLIKTFGKIRTTHTYMKTKTGLLTVAILGVLIALFSVGASSSGQLTYEYKVIIDNSPNPAGVLNREGKEGWELAAVTTSLDPSNSIPTYYLKRRLP